MKTISHYKKSFLSLILLSMLALQQGFTQTLTFPNDLKAFADWADVDADGDPDLLYSYIKQSDGLEVTRILLNNAGTFTFGSDTLTHTYGFVKWGDFDNDGDLDFAQLGPTPGIYENTGSLSFTKTTDVIPNYRGELDWGDYDNDGDLDLVVAGNVSGNWFDEGFVRLYENNNGSFSEVTSFLPVMATIYGIDDVKWVDYDNDSDLDLTFSNQGYTGIPSVEGVFLITNNGDGTFTDSGILLGGRRMAWVDYDEDGDLDVACGRSFTSANNSVMFNNNALDFSNSIEIPLFQLAHTGLTRLGDTDNDGDMDLLVAGGLDSNPANGRLLINNGTTFAPTATLYASLQFPTSGGFADIDGDHDLDILLTGASGSTYMSAIYTNNASVANTLPSVPTGLSLNFTGGGCTSTSSPATFSWNAATDNETASTGLTYNLRVGITPGGNEVFSGATSLKPEMGNVQLNTSWTLKNLDPGQTYYWSVEAVDNAYAHSGYSPEQTYTPPVATTIFNDAGFTFTGIGVGSVEWGDYDSDGDLDVLAVGDQSVSGTGSVNIYRNDGTTFTRITSQIFTPVTEATAKFLDFDNDNDLDIIVMGNNAGNNPILNLYGNLGGGSYGIIANTNFTGLYNGSLDVADYDNNGYPDIIVMGLDPSDVPQTMLYINTGNSFIQSEFVFPGLYDGDVAWHDKSDGYSDLIITGKDGTDNPITYYYRNTGGELSLLSTSETDLYQMSNSSIAANNIETADFYEYLAMGTTNQGTSGAFAYVYDDITETLPGLANGDVLWIDYDGDGDNDIVMTGAEGQGNVVKTWLYENNNDSYSLVCNAFPTEGYTMGRIARGDYDNDGDLDVFFTSFDISGQAFGRIYTNSTNTLNGYPGPPLNLALSSDCNIMNISWQDASDDHTPQNALTYNLKIGTTPGGNEILSAQALANGKKMLPAEGNNGNRNRYRIGLPASGRYYTGVQTVDNGLATSAWVMDSIDVSIVEDEDVSINEMNVPHYFSRADLAIDLDENGLTDFYNFFTFGHTVFYNNGNNTYSGGDVIQGKYFYGYIIDADDYDSDGMVDLLHNSGHQDLTSKGLRQDSIYLYANDGNNLFNRQNTYVLADSFFVTRVTDLNNDGNKDFIRKRYGEDYIKIAFNNGQGNVYKSLNMNAGNNSVYINDFLADFNSDGYTDILHIDQDSIGIKAHIFINDQHEGFVLHQDVFDVRNAQVFTDPIYTGDLDDDGDMDIVLNYGARDSVTNNFTVGNIKLYRNEGNVNFTPFDLAFKTNLLHGYTRFSPLADFDNDGDLDIITAEAYSDGVPHIIENRGNFNFYDQKICTAFQLDDPFLADLDGDNDIEAVMSDYRTQRNYSVDYNTTNLNIPPSEPGNLTSAYNFQDSTLTFSWTASSDAQTPTPGLSYNLRIGTSSDVADIIHPLSIISTGNLLDGKRMVARDGNAGQVTSWTFYKVIPGQPYYWSVQAIDHSYAGSHFATEQVAASNIGSGNGTISGGMGSGSSGSSGGRVVANQDVTIDEPIADALIALVNVSTSDTLFLDITDNNGDFDFLGVPDGAYQIYVDYDSLPMAPDNPVLNFSGNNEIIQVTVLVGNSNIRVSVVTQVTAIDEKILQSEIHVYPNPAKEQVTIKYTRNDSSEKLVEVSLMNLHGQLLDHQRLANSGIVSFDTGFYPSGIYVIRITSGGKTSVNYKLVKY